MELQQTLSQQGFESGTALLRLNFKNSGTPLEEAMAEISKYFKGGDKVATSTPEASGTTSETSEPSTAAPAPQEETAQVADSTSDAAPELKNDPPEPMDIDKKEITQQAEPTSEKQAPTAVVAPSSVPLQLPTTGEFKIFAPPSSSIPAAARRAFNEADYVPTVEHARSHQNSLSTKGKNTRLLSDKELADEEAAQQKKLETVAKKGVTFRIRMPDESQVMVTFADSDTASKLYESVRDLLEFPTQPFHLRYISPKGAPLTMKDGLQRLIQDLKMTDREVLTFLWDENASNEARLSKKVLKQEWREKAQVMKVDEPEADNKPEEKPTFGSNLLGKMKAVGNMSNADKERKLKGILGKGLFKK